MRRLCKLVLASLAMALFPCLSWAESVPVQATTLGVNFCKSDHQLSAGGTDQYGFYDATGSRGGLLEEKAWVNITTASGNIELQDTVNATTYRMRWQGSSDVWGPSNSSAGKLLASYLDNAITITLSGLPISGYDVAILFSGDGGKFSAVTVNGTDKTYNAEGQLVDGSTAWGDRTHPTVETKTLSATGTATTGNVMYLAGMTSPTLNLQNKNDPGNKIRGTIAAIQIYPKAATYTFQRIDATSQGATTVALSSLGIAAETQDVELRLAAGATLMVDGSPSLARLSLRSEGIVGIAGSQGVDSLEAVLSGIETFDYDGVAGLDIGTLKAKRLVVRPGQTLVMASLG